ncbi:glycosyltransferase family 4 protein [Cohnella phaseoli]|uniref:Spore coat protein SA n=1 Tax=Cohnella phaseoli TaxID=456490 RepID=A0A3D9KNH4_9BACL|nr:glycosyltransferase family 4 protein [Cohnella phaseoli]RED87783.1 spore coat protein SA [Cohnella phaseoli]
MRILIVAPEQIPVPPPLGGSVEITILALAKQLARKHRVTIVSRAHRRYPRHSVIDGVHIHRVPSGTRETYLSNVKKFIRGKSFDLVQVDNRPRFVGPIKQMSPGTPVSLFLHSLTFVSPPYATRSSAAAGLSQADIVIANSTSLKKQLSARFPGSAGKIRKVWLGVDTLRFTPPGKRNSDRAFTVLFAGRVIPRKGVPVLLKAIKLAQKSARRPIQAIIAGGSPRPGYSQRMRALALKLRVNARFLGTVPHRRIHRVFRKADVFVCPSQKHEAFGLVNVEAMASGVPVIASSNGGIKEIVRHNRNGILVRRYRQPQSFATAIAKLAGNKALRLRMARAARRDSLRQFSWQATAARLGRIYKART